MTTPDTPRIQIGQMTVTPGNPEKNLAKMTAWIEEASRDGADIIVFPEMAIPGYLLGDLWEQEAFLRDCEAAGNEIRELAKSVTVIFGNIAIDWERRNEDGRPRKYNALFAAEDQSFLSPDGGLHPFVMKTLHPNYREFDDSRHFFDTRKCALEQGLDPRDLIKPLQSTYGSLACMLCEDAWDDDYTVSPVTELASHDPDIFINISCSPYTQGKNAKRNRVFANHAQTVGRPFIYANNVGIQNNGKTVYVFDGSSTIYDASGRAISLAQPFKETRATPPLPDSATASVDQSDSTETVCEALRYAAKEFLNQTGISRLVIGLSGGIDSAVAAALYGSVLPPEDLLLVNMPSQHNSSTTISIAETIAREIGCHYLSVPIDASIDLTISQISGLTTQQSSGASETLTLSEFALQNVQARDRSSRILGALASSFGGAFTCNANKAEMTVGYSTLYGDLAGCLAILGDLWKEDVYALGKHLNENVWGREIIPDDCFTINPSAELSASQDIDQGQGDPFHYPYHDKLFRSWVEHWNRATPEDILEHYAKGTLFSHIGFQIATCRSNHPNIGTNGLITTDTLEGAFLQNTQKTHLNRRRDVSNLIKKQGAAVCQLKSAFALLLRPCKGALFMAKQLTFNKILWKGRTVHADKRRIPTFTSIMQRLRHQLFPRPRLPTDQDGRHAVRDLSNLLINRTHGTAIPHHILNLVSISQLLP